jgi:hypothetical protein
MRNDMCRITDILTGQKCAAYDIIERKVTAIITLSSFLNLENIKY